MVGFGYDSHRLAENESLILGGINIKSDIGTVAHSDGDALIHALADALLGAAGLGDIGELYPDTDIKYKGADSQFFLREIVALIKNLGFTIVNIDVTIILEKPKLSEYKPLIKKNIAKICEIDEKRANIKAKTNEKLGFTGRSEGIAAYCIAEIQ